MNPHQAKWWEQARSDMEVLRLFRRNAVAPCHQLHYLQMVAEKVAKAYFWRVGGPPARSHAGFVQFLRSLAIVPSARQGIIATALEFRNFKQFQAWVKGAAPMAYELETLAPALALNGPNPEYPWPHEAPVEYPAGYEFILWGRLIGTTPGRQFLRFVEIAVDRFPAYA